MTEDVLCRFSILRASEVAAEGRFTRSMRRAEERLRRQYGTSIDRLPEEVRERFHRRYRWQEWPYNHVCGALALVAVDDNALRGDVFLSRRAFPRDHEEHDWHLPSHGSEILLYATGPELLVMPENNISHQEVAGILVEQAQQLVRNEGCGTRAAMVSVEPALEAIDFVALRRLASRRRRRRSGQGRQRELT